MAGGAGNARVKAVKGPAGASKKSNKPAGAKTGGGGVVVKGKRNAKIKAKGRK